MVTAGTEHPPRPVDRPAVPDRAARRPRDRVALAGAAHRDLAHAPVLRRALPRTATTCTGDREARRARDLRRTRSARAARGRRARARRAELVPGAHLLRDCGRGDPPTDPV